MLDPNVLSQVILNGCRRATGKPPEAVHASIMESIALAESLMPVLAGAPMPAPQPVVMPQPNGGYASGYIQHAQQPVAPTPFPDIPDPVSGKFAQIAPPESALSAAAVPQVKQYHTTQEIIAYLKQECPERIRVKPPKFDKPIELHRFIQSPPGGVDGFPVRISYMIAGQDEGPRAQVSPSEQRIDCEAVMRSILEQANAMYSPTQRKIEAKRPTDGMSFEEAASVIENNSDSLPRDAADESYLIDEKTRINSRYVVTEQGKTVDRWAEYGPES